jgi:hypothetical protein
MKLRSKQGTARFVVTHPNLPHPVEVNPRDHLTPEQRRRMATHPDIILQMSHWIAAEYRKMGFDGVQVRARVRVSLNGRTPRALVDPEVDLAAQPRNLLPAAWIVPLSEPLPVRRLPWWPTRPESRRGQDGDDADLAE